MGQVLTIKPAVQFPKAQPFEVPDTFNGPKRGQWWWRGGDGRIHGPFFTATAAEEDMFDQKIEPFQDVTHHWWWTEPRTGRNHGPFRNLRDADAAICGFLNFSKI